MLSESEGPLWTVTLICGAAGVGKSSVARQLATRYGSALTEADDIVTAVRALTIPEHFPTLHYWDTHREAGSWTPEKIADLHFAVADALRPGLEAVIADHIEFRSAVVLEGDYLVPELAAGFVGDVVAVVLSEPAEDQIIANFGAREPDSADPGYRAKVSALIGEGLEGRAAALGVPVVPATPWSDGVGRVDRALRLWHSGSHGRSCSTR